jgi:hypothetical protein
MDEITPSNFVGFEAWNHAVEVAFDPLALDLQLGADRIAQVDVEAHQAAVSGFGLERRVGRIDTKTQFLVFLGQGGTGGHAQSQCRKGQQCFFHYVIPGNQDKRLWRV